MKLHEYGLLIGVPEAFCAPDTVAVYVVPAASELVGVNVATVFRGVKPTDPATLFPPESTTVNDTVLGVTACENVADGATDTALPVDPPARRHRRHRRRHIRGHRVRRRRGRPEYRLGWTG